MSYKTIISAKNLIENINNPNYRLFDCRCDIKDTAYGLEAYNEGHIPGAIFVDIDNDLASEKHQLAEDIRCQILRSSSINYQSGVFQVILKL